MRDFLFSTDDREIQYQYQLIDTTNKKINFLLFFFLIIFFLYLLMCEKLI